MEAAGDESLERAEGLALGLALGHPTGEVVLGWRVTSDLRDGDAVDRRVELAGTTVAEPVAVCPSGRDGQWGCAGVPGQLRVAGEPPIKADLADDAGGGQEGAAGDLEQLGGVSLDEWLELAGGQVEGRIEVVEVPPKPVDLAGAFCHEVVVAVD